MKNIIGLFLLTLLICSNGCMTYDAVQRAQGKPYLSGIYYVDPPDNKKHPAFYALVPITVPLDIATSPFQGIFYGVTYYIGTGLGNTP